MSNPLLDTVLRHKSGEHVGIYSVCSAHPLVIESAILQALEDESYLLVEATSNQVDQYGGYTGMRPPDFRNLVVEIADRRGLGEERVVLGGDHLGPNPWQHLPAEEAMTRAETLIEAYVAAGFTKIHLDCSMPLVDDPSPLGDEVVAGRAARLAQKAEQAAAATTGASDLLYVVGTEVPTPGGAQERLDKVQPTSAKAAKDTLAHHRQAFGEAGLEEAWARVIALVVQPGVEFDHLHVIDYERSAAKELGRVPEDYSQLVFEAHSTDYQTTANLSALVEDHWTILKVGPALTFAMREALFALAAIEDELLDELHEVGAEASGQMRSRLIEVLERRMLEEPTQWEKYYTGDANTQRLLRQYSYSDRIRYYWSDPEVQAAQERLLSNLGEHEIPPPLLSQYLPEQYARVRRGELAVEPKALIFDRVRDALRVYVRACNPVVPPYEKIRGG